MTNDNLPDDAMDLGDATELPSDDDGEIAFPELEWEKGVEFALARELQAWHVMSQLRIEADIKREEGSRLTVDEVLDQVRLRSQEPRYLPMDGNAESTLGDALAAVDINQLLLIECKEMLDSKGWTRESQQEVENPADAKAKVRNRGGKNRVEKLQRIGAKIIMQPSVTVKNQGQKCHVLVGNAYQAGVPASARADLMFTDYWDYVIGSDGQGDKPTIEARPIFELQNEGLSLEDFRAYVYLLLEDDVERTSSDDTRWIQRELVLLAHGTNRETNEDGWIAGRILESKLVEILKLDKKYPALMEKILAREAATDLAQKQRNAEAQRQRRAAEKLRKPPEKAEAAAKTSMGSKIKKN